MSAFLRKKLNPLLLKVVAFKDVPAKTDPCYSPIYSTIHFVDGQKFKTHKLPQQRTCRFNYEHCFLLGKQNDPVQLKEMLATKVVKVYLHDNDQYTQQEEGREFSKGVAKFTLRDLLRPFCREVKLRSEVYPCKH